MHDKLSASFHVVTPKDLAVAALLRDPTDQASQWYLITDLCHPRGRRQQQEATLTLSTDVPDLQSMKLVSGGRKHLCTYICTPRRYCTAGSRRDVPFPRRCSSAAHLFPPSFLWSSPIPLPVWLYLSLLCDSFSIRRFCIAFFQSTFVSIRLLLPFIEHSIVLSPSFAFYFPFGPECIAMTLL